jgi:AcrR family transcriptional regulator
MEPGLRERKKEQTRQLIADTARRLFAERGFEAVTVAEVARAAHVAEKTVFNYFPTKEELFYSRLEAFEEELLDAVRERAPGESIPAAVRGFLMGQGGVLAMRSPGGDEEATEQLRTVTRVITESPALLARERQVFASYAEALAALIAEETGARRGAIEPQVAANALLGAHRALIDYVRARALAGAPASQVAREVRARAKRAFDLLDEGLGEYGVKDG